MKEDKTKNKNYGAKAIKILEGLEAVRKRPAMYIGSTNIAGLHHLIYEVVDNSVDEALGGYCNHIKIVIHSDGSCSVEDNGRGIPVDIHPTEKISAAQVVLTKLHAGGKFDKDSYKYSGGLHGVGISVVNALSSQLNLKIWKNGKEYIQKYQKGGKPEGPLTISGNTKKQGTYIRFYPDKTIFEHTDFNLETLTSRLRELAFLNKSLKIEITDNRINESRVFFYEGGIASFVKYINTKKNPAFNELIEFKKEDKTYILDFACQYNEGYSYQLFSFVNNIKTVEGGTHEAGFRSALTKSCNRFAQKHKLIKDGSLSSEDVREGFVGVISIKVPEPQFEGQTKTKLGNSEVRGIVDSWLYSFFETYFEEHPAVAKKIVQKSVLAQQARTAAKKARELTRRKTVLESAVLPGKLSDCSDTDASKTELYIVEGDSAGGSAKQGRDRFTQAILPLKGKILNVEKARLDKILSNEEIKSLITAIGCGVGNDAFNIEKARYHKIVIMTDADVDGAHIRILILTLFFRYMKPMIEAGYLYVAQPPLYKVKLGKKEKYLQNDSELNDFLLNWTKENGELIIDNKMIVRPKLDTLLDSLFKYQFEIQKFSNAIEISTQNTHELIKFLNKENWKFSTIDGSCNDNFDENIFDTQKLIAKLKSYFPKYEIISSEQDTKDEIVEDETKKQTIFLIFKKLKKTWQIPLNFFINEETEKILNLFKPISNLEKETWNLKLKSKESGLQNGSLALFDSIIKLGKSLIKIQRYKGLGEMNPDQLWETTMDPANRKFLQVTIEDAIKADQWFTALMGDEVAPRRNYIEEHAHFVKNLDI